MGYKKFNFSSKDSWVASASDYPDEIKKNYMVGQTKNIGSIDSIADLFKDRTKKRKVIELIMKVKSNKIQQKVEIPMDTKIALSDIDMVIQEVLQKPTVNIHVS